jgi:sialate O-acetylesterase
MKRFLFIIICSGLIKLLDGAVILPSVISDHMVLQQNSMVNLWGHARPAEAVTIITGWNGKSYTAVADKDGKWIVQVSTDAAGGPYSISFTGTNKIEIRDVMLGEVWVCGGQSNMEFSFYNLGGWKYFMKLKSTFESYGLERIRLCTVKKNYAENPLDSCSAGWLAADTTSILNFSATAFCFGLEIYKKLNVPVGLIASSWSGTPAEAWTPGEYLRYTPGLSYYLNHPNNPEAAATAPSVLFNAMINPIRQYTIKGFIWYQGESNRYDSDLYGDLFKAMIRAWRKYWERPELPFYFVQIAPFNYGDFPDASGYLREAQEKALALENTGMAVTLDIGDINDIHPKNKQETGRRLANLALAQTYKLPLEGNGSGPSYWFSRIDGGRIQVYFRNTECLYGKSEKITGFSIAGEDGVFKSAMALIMGNSVMVYNKDIANPLYVRYAFGNTDTATVFNKQGLPAGSFRTDSFPVNYRATETNIRFNPVAKIWDVSLSCKDPLATIFYSLNASETAKTRSRYVDTLKISSTCIIRANAFLKDVPSQRPAEVRIVKHEGLACQTKLKYPPSPKYSGNQYTLTDGILGSTNFRDGCWLGFNAEDMQCILDLGKTEKISEVKINFLVNTPAYIFPPLKVEVYTSENGAQFKKAGEFIPAPAGVASLTAKPEIMPVAFDHFDRDVRYIKIIAKNQKSNPSWHSAPGEKCWLFTDEIVCSK